MIASGNDLTVEDIFANKASETSKAEIEAEDAALVKIGEQTPAPVPTDPEAAGPDPNPADFAWEEGIFEDAEFPIGLGLSFENRWQGTVGEWNVVVYAEAYRDDASRGVVLLQLKDPDTWGNTFEGPFEAPVPGPLRIEGFKGAVLDLSGKGGETATFDVASRTFK